MNSVTVQRFDSMHGVTMASVTVNADRDRMMFTAVDGREWCFDHEQDCCERVSIDDVCGELSDLVGSPILQAEEVSSVPPPDWKEKLGGRAVESFTWTFYRFATAKGSVTVRWLGQSNGYYSERVSYSEPRSRGVR